MKYARAICLSMIILICCLSPVISAGTHEYGNSTTNLTVNNTPDLNGLNNYCRKYPNFNIFFVNNENATYSPSDDIYFEVTFDFNFHGPLDIYLDKEYITTVYPDDGNVVIGFVNYYLSPGTHLIECEFGGDENFFIEYSTLTFDVI